QGRSHTRIPLGEIATLIATLLEIDTDGSLHFTIPQIPDLSHSVLSPMSFRLDYRRPGGTTSNLFQRNIRLQVDITCATPPSNESSTPSPNFDSTPLDRPTIYCITFTLLSGQ